MPGADIDAGTFGRRNDVYGTPAGMAKSLYAQTGRGSAVIAWAGYTTPIGVGVDAATGSLAEAGADRLTRFDDGAVAVAEQ
ncbi:alpha/beta hydrolase [Streptomyces laculatispora]|uniref:alpha/beta hydrolase n=1 Tax=Streptomyces laculatispora TaxID=887464 RepID=UPI0027DC9846|nr:alpha/beta hydrolase [Streptomyces laculatispora]